MIDLYQSTTSEIAANCGYIQRNEDGAKLELMVT